jgi:hypothetical protein
MANGLSLLKTESSPESMGKQNPICTSEDGFIVVPRTNAYETEPKLAIRSRHKPPTQIFLLIGLVGRVQKKELPFLQ